MDKGRERSSPDIQPWNKCSKLRWCKQIHLEHCDGMRSNGFIPDFVDSQLGDYVCQNNELGRIEDNVANILA